MIFIKNNHNTLIFIINFYWIYHEICYYPVNHYSDEFMQGSLKSCIYNYLITFKIYSAKMLKRKKILFSETKDEYTLSLIPWPGQEFKYMCLL